jgi:RES domain-containing protein
LPEFRISKFQGIIWRQTAVGALPLDTQGSLIYGGRFNPPALLPILYTSLSIAGVKAEFLKFAKFRGANPNILLPRELHQLWVGLETVIDLTDSYNRKLLNISVQALVGKNLILTQKIGLQLNGLCDAILTYSAAVPKEKNLNLYEAGTRHVSVIASSIIDDMSDWDKVTPL